MWGSGCPWLRTGVTPRLLSISRREGWATERSRAGSSGSRASPLITSTRARPSRNRSAGVACRSWLSRAPEISGSTRTQPAPTSRASRVTGAAVASTGRRSSPPRPTGKSLPTGCGARPATGAAARRSEAEWRWRQPPGEAGGGRRRRAPQEAGGGRRCGRWWGRGGRRSSRSGRRGEQRNGRRSGGRGTDGAWPGAGGPCLSSCQGVGPGDPAAVEPSPPDDQHPPPSPGCRRQPGLRRR